MNQVMNPPQEELLVADRCDRCGAQAYMRATYGDNQLLFCAHHGRQHIDKLVYSGWQVEDQSHRLNVVVDTFVEE